MTTYLPIPALQPYIKNFMVTHSDEEGIYKVLPDTSVVIGFQYKGGLAYMNNGVEVKLSKAGVTGLRKTHRVFKNTAGTGTVLVVFKEGGAAPFFKQPVHELFGESLGLDNFMLRSELLLLEEQLCEATTHEKRIAVVEKFLLARLSPNPPDKLVLGALALIHQTKGTIRIADMLKQLHTSQSPLEKRFRAAVGASPKKFASIVRLKHAIAAQALHPNLTSLAHDSGFYDQAHFIKEFKLFTGDTPEQFFSVK